MVELKETPGKAGETPEKRGEPYCSLYYIKKVSFIILPIYAITFYLLTIISGGNLENWGYLTVISIPLLRGLADMVVGILIFYSLEKFKWNKIQKYSGCFRIVGGIGFILCIFSVNYYDVISVFFSSLLLFGAVLSEKKYKISSLSKYCFAIYLNHALIIKLVLGVQKSEMDYKDRILFTFFILSIVIIYSIVTHTIINKLTNRKKLIQVSNT